MSDMTDNEIIKALECCAVRGNCNGCPREKEWDKACASIGMKDALDLITRQKAEIERLHDEVSKTRRKALLEASSKFAGHSDYHGDTILCKLICMWEGKEVGIAKPLDMGEIKFKAIKEFAERLKDKSLTKWDYHDAVDIEEIDNLVKEMVGDTE